jgi:5'-nucleotidase
VSVTPIQHDMTAYDAFDSLGEWDWDESAGPDASE